MSSRNGAKNKGDNAEREVARLLADLTGWPVRRKLGAGRADDIGDLDGLPDCTAQVKHYRDISRAIRETLDELGAQQANAGTTFAVGLIRRRGGWSAVMTIEQFATLLREATRPEDVEDRGLVLGRGHGHDMRDLWEADEEWRVLCECGEILPGLRRHDAIDGWHAHRDEEGL